MKNFWSLITNGKYSIGCTGQTVFVYDDNMIELASFKDLKYAYLPVISPKGDIFVVKSTGGRMAVYSLETMSLITKFRYSKYDCSQDDGLCFSYDGALLFNIERHGKYGFETAISVYDTETFNLLRQFTFDEALAHIEYDESKKMYYVLGFDRDENNVAVDYFVCEFDGYELKNKKTISYNEYEFYNNYIGLKLSGFSKKKYEWSYIDCPLEDLKNRAFSLPKFYDMK